MPANKDKSSTSVNIKNTAIKSKNRAGKNQKNSPARQVRKKNATAKTSVSRKKTRKSSLYRSLLKPALIFIAVTLMGYMLVIDQRITQRFEGRLWQLPAHVYARPLELFVGKSISSKQLAFELDYLNYQKIDITPAQAAQYRRLQDTFEIKTRPFIFWDGEEPGHSIRVSINDNKVTQLYDIENKKDANLVRFDAGYLTGIFPSHSQDRILLKLEEVPDSFIKMLLLIEDRRFFSHWGVDPVSISRALIVNLFSGEAVQGGSTLTQQLVKNLFLSSEKTIIRKINEALMSLLLEFHYDKKLILETYINEIYLGQDRQRAIHGFGLASEFYFGQSLDKLSIDQMAVLVGMVKGASYYNPKRNPEHARSRRDVVIHSMLQADLLTPHQSAKLLAQPVETVKHARAGKYPAFIDVVKLQLQQDYQPDDLQSDGLRVFTTLDPYVQFKTEQAIKTMLNKVSKDDELQAAAVVVSPLNGDVLAVVGDRQPSFQGFNRAINAKRQIGSLIKPVVYLTALQQPHRYTLATMLNDTAFTYPLPNQPDWSPLNYSKQFHGEVTLYEALIKSYNVPAVRTGLDVGLKNIISNLSALGYKESLNPYPSLILGAVSMSPMDVASIYQSFSANGFHSPLRSVHAVLDKNRQPLQRYSLDVDNRVNTKAMALVNSALIDVTRYGTARLLSKQLSIQVAGKTGTSDDLRDSWFAGFSGDVMAVVWAGFDDNRETGLTGSSGAMKIWSRMMQDVAYKPYQLPAISGLKRTYIDRKNGLLTEKTCENALELTFIEGSQPDRKSDCDTSGSGNWFINLFN